MAIQIALLEWINTFTIAEEIKSLSELTDGHILWDILRDVDPTYFTSSLPEPRGTSTKWIPRYENLKFLHKTLVSYISEECDQTPFSHRAGDGLQAIAQDASTPELVKLFKLVLQATILSPRQEEYILKMTSLAPASQQALKALIQEREVVAEGNDQYDGASEPLSPFAQDPALEFEERIGRLMSENQRILQEKQELQCEMRNLDARLMRLQDNNSIMQQKLAEAEDRLQINGSAHNDSENHSVKHLESKIQQQENDIADQEARTVKQARKTEALQRKIDNMEASLNSSAKKAKDARDELDVVIKERDALAKKANMADKFKQQLQASNELKNENETLLRQLDEFRREAEDTEQAGRDKIRLETELEEYRKLVPNLEEHHADLVRTKRQLELDNESLHKRWSAASEQHKQDQEIIAKLNQRVRSSSVSSVGSPDDDTLDCESSGFADTQTKAGERASNIEKQNQELQSIASEQASKILSLQRLLDEASNRPELQNAIRRSSFASNSQEQPGSVQRFGIPTMNGDAQPAHSLFSIEDVQKLRARLDDEEAKRKEVDRQLRKTVLELNVARKDRRSLMHRYMNADEQHSNHLAVAYVALDKLEMVAQIKADNSEELKLVQEINDRLESENREKNDLLSKSIGYNATLQNDSKLVSQEIRDLTAAIKEGKQPEDQSPAIDAFSRMIMDSRKETVETQKEVEQQKTTIADLEKRLHDAEADVNACRNERREEEQEPASLAELTALRGEITNLKRELRLMASAFHEQAGRLQLSDVTLRRRNEQQQPASWLGRQRRSVIVAAGVGR
ncbi:MAG: hypothetical protein LQ345_000480 [Seirophora villosa]|nr:MAG: hypothetical protein LQ345_000480 [Seirophora villosa]